MDSPILLLLIPLLIGATAAGVWFGTKPLRDLRRDPYLAEQWKLPFRERWRYGKLARSEQVISDPVESKRAENAARFTVRVTQHALSRMQLAFIGALLLFSMVFRLRDDATVQNLLLSFGTPLLLVIAYVANRRALQQMRRTAQLNGWDLDS